VGVQDIKTLKIQIRSGNKREYNSPWNIAVDFKVRMSFIPSEIVPMLDEYGQAEGVTMDKERIAERLYYLTSGHPFLVSKLCKTIAEDILPEKNTKEWTMADLDASVKLLLRENNTNFDSIIKQLENNSELYSLVNRVIIEGEKIIFNPDEPIMHFGRLHGIFKRNTDEILKIHNRIYEQRLYNYMTAKAIVQLSAHRNYADHFVSDNHELDLKAVLLKFQQTIKEQYSEKNKAFLEAHGRVLFLSFLAPILNGHGHSFKEVQISFEKRLDVVITFYQYRYIVELKKWYGEKAHQKGLDQLADYLDTHNVSEGWLVIFDERKEKTWAAKMISHKGKEIFAVWV
ncbi:MAG: AAA family ATPase, partial [Bacteroidota bacterium]